MAAGVAGAASGASAAAPAATSGFSSFLAAIPKIAGIVSVGANLLAAGSSAAGGFAAQEESRAQIRATREETAAAKIQSERDTKRLRSRQLVNFLKSGVQLEGTPLAILEETEKLGAEDIESLERQEQAQIGRFEAQGRTALLSGVTSSIGSIGRAATAAGRL